MADDKGEALALLKVDGGAAQNDLLMQLQADLLEVPVSRPQTVETTALGAAMLAGLAVGFWRDQEELAATWCEERRFVPQANQTWRNALLEQWHAAVAKT